jgi:glycosyltransferase involved in cell wall biosynthesis
MKILIITEYLPASDDGEITGGVEAYVHYLRRHLSEEHQVEVLARETDGSVWDAASVASIPGRLAFLARSVVRGLRSDADVVVATTYVTHPLGWLVARLRRRPVVFWYADVLLGTWRSGQFGKLAGIIGELTERLILRLKPDRFIAISESTATKLRAHGIEPGRVSVVGCGYDQATVDAVEPLRGDSRQIVVVNRLVPYKRVDLAIRALAKLDGDAADANLVIVGQGPEQPALAALAEELGVADRVRFAGFVRRHRDVLALVAGADAFVSGSEIEGFGIAVIEAMALGTPYVVTDIPAFREVTGGGVGGALVPVGDESAMAAALAQALGDARGGRATRTAHAARYRWDAITAQTVEVLGDVVSRRRGRSR